MKTWQATCSIIFFLFLIVGLSTGIVLYVIDPLVTKMRELGLRGVVENIWCGENGCEPGQGGKR